MDEQGLTVLLHAAGAAIPVPAAPTERILVAGRRRVRRRRVAEMLAAVMVVAAVLVPLGLAQRATAPATDPGGCGVQQPRVLPEWARAGFSPPDQLTSYVLGERGEIVAIPFGPLTSPPTEGRNNKILWVVRTPGRPGPWTVTAHRFDDPHLTLLVQNLPDGPGPSAIDVPAPGCWTFDLRWDGGGDAVDLRYEPG